MQAFNQQAHADDPEAAQRSTSWRRSRRRTAHVEEAGQAAHATGSGQAACVAQDAPPRQDPALNNRVVVSRISASASLGDLRQPPQLNFSAYWRTSETAAPRLPEVPANSQRLPEVPPSSSRQLPEGVRLADVTVHAAPRSTSSTEPSTASSSLYGSLASVPDAAPVPEVESLASVPEAASDPEVEVEHREAFEEAPDFDVLESVDEHPVEEVQDVEEEKSERTTEKILDVSGNSQDKEDVSSAQVTNADRNISEILPSSNVEVVQPLPKPQADVLVATDQPLQASADALQHVLLPTEVVQPQQVLPLQVLPKLLVFQAQPNAPAPGGSTLPKSSGATSGSGQPSAEPQPDGSAQSESSGAAEPQSRGFSKPRDASTRLQSDADASAEPQPASAQPPARGSAAQPQPGPSAEAQPGGSVAQPAQPAQPPARDSAAQPQPGPSGEAQPGGSAAQPQPGPSAAAQPGGSAAQRQPGSSASSVDRGHPDYVPSGPKRSRKETTRKFRKRKSPYVESEEEESSADEEAAFPTRFSPRNKRGYRY